MTLKPSEIVQKARKILKQNQHDFAKRLGKTQSVLSRYESGSVEPPTAVIMHCMHILNKQPALEFSDDIEEIVKKIKTLNGEKYIKVRTALNILLDKIVVEF